MAPNLLVYYPGIGFLPSYSALFPWLNTMIALDSPLPTLPPFLTLCYTLSVKLITSNIDVHGRKVFAG